MHQQFELFYKKLLKKISSYIISPKKSLMIMTISVSFFIGRIIFLTTFSFTSKSNLLKNFHSEKKNHNLHNRLG